MSISSSVPGAFSDGRHVGHADRLLQERRLRAAGDDADLLAVVEHGMAVTRDGALGHLEADRWSSRAPLRFLLAQHVAAEELRLVPADDPAEVGFDDGRSSRRCRCRSRRIAASRRSVSRAPRPAGIKPCGFPACSSASQTVGAMCRRHHHFETVFAGIAGARHGAADRGNLAVGEPVAFDRREIDRRQRLQDRFAPSALDGDQRVAIAGIDSRRRPARLPWRAPMIQAYVLVDVAGVDDEQVMRRPEAIDQQVVHERAFGRRQAGVLNLADLQLRGVVAR